jgi:hypothetical protein
VEPPGLPKPRLLWDPEPNEPVILKMHPRPVRALLTPVSFEGLEQPEVKHALAEAADAAAAFQRATDAW